MTSLALAEALRNEIRTILDNDGKPFDLHVARRVYDLAIVARDVFAAGVKTTKEAIQVVEDVGGPLDSIAVTSENAVATPNTETFGVRLMREILAMLPTLRPANNLPLATEETPDAWMPALMMARRAGMTDVSAEIETKMFGRALNGGQPIAPQSSSDLITHQDDCSERES